MNPTVSRLRRAEVRNDPDAIEPVERDGAAIGVSVRLLTGPPS
jgi:hypothetical protein